MDPKTPNEEQTGLGEGGATFPQTTESFLGRLEIPSGPEGRRAFEDLCRRYWRPVYFFLRIVRRKSNEDAKDLTQAFFAWIFEDDLVSRYRRDRAPFRVFL